MSAPGLRHRAEQNGWATKKQPVQPEGEQTFTLDNLPEGSNWTPEALLKRVGLNPDEWRITNVKARGGHYGNPQEPNSQLRLEVSVQPIVATHIFRAADPSKWSAPPKPRKQKKGKHLDAVVISDHHAPYFEPTFHRLFLQYLEDAQPGLIEVNGDLLDFATISRHRERENQVASVNECIQSGFEILRDYREVCPDAKIRFKRGNHSERLRHLIIDNATGLHNITPAGETVPALSLERLLHLDRLHIEYIDVEWDQAKTKLSRKLTARHGFSTSKNAGEQMLDKLSGSTVQGHDHRAAITLRTEHTDNPDDPIRVRMAMQGGCACIIPGGLGYVAGGEPNWQNAYGAFRIWPDGDFYGALGIYVPGRLLATNGKRYVR